MVRKQVATVEEVRGRLEEWRQSRPKGAGIKVTHLASCILGVTNSL
jgi:hypothetical protein